MCQGSAPGLQGQFPFGRTLSRMVRHGRVEQCRRGAFEGGGDGGCGSWFLVVPGHLGRFRNRKSQLSKIVRWGCPRFPERDRNDQVPPGTRNHGSAVSSHEVGLGSWFLVVPGHLGRFWKSQIPTFENREMGFAISRIEPNDQVPPGTKHQIAEGVGKAEPIL